MTDTVTVSRELLRQVLRGLRMCDQQNQVLDDTYTALRAALEQPAPVQEQENHFKSACWLRTSFSIGRYLMSNAHGRWNGAEKALYHRELCKFYVAAVRGFDDEGLVDLCGEDFKAVHKSTQQLTDRMDEVIGFPLDSAPDYAKLEPLFFEHFHTLAMQALQVSQQPAPVLQDIEQYRMQMAGISSAAFGYWKIGDDIHPEYDTTAIRDVANLYAKYDELYKAANKEPIEDNPDDYVMQF